MTLIAKMQGTMLSKSKATPQVLVVFVCVAVLLVLCVCVYNGAHVKRPILMYFFKSF